MTDEELIAGLRSDHPDYLTNAAADRIEYLKAEVARLDAGWQAANVAALTNALDRDAASAAAYEAAASDKVIAGIWAQYGSLERSKDVIRALSTPDQTAALDRVRAEAKAEGMREAADLLRGQGYNTAVREILAAIPKEGA